MSKIILICTGHHEIGKCNSNELHKIIESVSPGLIFEELPNDFFNRYYKESQLSGEPLEIRCIKKYLQNHDIKHIPVDIDASADLSDSEIEYMINTFKKYDVYKKLEYEQRILTAQGGFAYLNSEKCSELFVEIKSTEKKLMEFDINKNQLARIYKLFYDEHNDRENQMLQNIYNYSKENQYDQAVFLIGAAHRNSIIQKITEYEKLSELKLNWTFYNKSIDTYAG